MFISFNYGFILINFIFIAVIPSKNCSECKMKPGMLKKIMGPVYTITCEEPSYLYGLSKNITKIGFVRAVCTRGVMELKGINQDADIFCADETCHLPKITKKYNRSIYLNKSRSLIYCYDYAWRFLNSSQTKLPKKYQKLNEILFKQKISQFQMKTTTVPDEWEPWKERNQTENNKSWPDKKKDPQDDIQAQEKLLIRQITRKLSNRVSVQDATTSFSDQDLCVIATVISAACVLLMAVLIGVALARRCNKRRADKHAQVTKRHSLEEKINGKDVLVKVSDMNIGIPKKMNDSMLDNNHSQYVPPNGMPNEYVITEQVENRTQKYQ